jgi:starch-binding outer membrane protein, SusD/RagB family
MQRYILKCLAIATVVFAVFLLTSCRKDYLNPSAATEDAVFNSVAGLTGVDVGLQRTFSLSQASPLYNIVTMDALLTKQAFVLNQGNTNEYKLSLGEKQVDANNTLLTGLWITCNKIIYDANKVIKASANLSDKSYASG